MDFAFDDMYVWLVLGLFTGRGQFLNFLATQMIVLPKSIFLAVNASLHCLNNVVGVYLVYVSLHLSGQQGLVDFFPFAG
jgi:hypothetical protein